jgi:hypothetical protein
VRSARVVDPNSSVGPGVGFVGFGVVTTAYLNEKGRRARVLRASGGPVRPPLGCGQIVSRIYLGL